ncbi:hypothetical protein Tsubulata_029230 [Turnera subulata]|uniref:Pentacotripeptide-repeat region of PRORP domain-containing protein n=1 Tax=Turnera subulata TaxID=218843 RepID=A0A9Q0FQN0_9ROSI|nr:hypothetical protein Tsubulata_029230 [Turnera subulata]
MILSGLLREDTFAASKVLKFSTESPFIRINQSCKIFDYVENPNGFVYNTMMRAFIQRNKAYYALSMYKMMLEGKVEADNYTFPLLLQSCSVRLAEVEGRLVHGHVLKVGFHSDVYVQNTLIHMYAVCGEMNDARNVFDESPVLDLVSWNSILAGYVAVGNVEEAKCIYDAMPERNVIASNSMIVLFGKKGHVLEARRLFNEMEERDLVSWSALISCYEQNEMHEEALVMFKEMTGEGIVMDEVVVLSVLAACAHLSAVEVGKSVHGLAVKYGIESFVSLQNALIHMYSTCGDLVAAESLFTGGCSSDVISWNSMISGYLKYGKVEMARDLFDSMPKRDVVSWSTMVSGYSQHDRFADALELFQEMQINGFTPEEMTLVSVISACTHLAAFDQGKWVHTYITKNGLKISVFLGTALIDMYMKFGFIENAVDIFQSMEDKGVPTWNVMISGLAMNGLVEKSLDMFSKMKECGLVPNGITFVAVLGACRHMGLVDQGRSHFHSMIHEHKIEPNVKHYGCMVDLLARAGMLKEAEELLYSIPMAPDVSTWGALLGACEKFGDNEIGERVGRKLVELHPDHDGFNVLLSKISASKGNWDDVHEIWGKMMQHGVTKTRGCSMIES